MNKRDWLVGITGIAVLAASIYFAFVYFSEWLATLNPNVAAALTTATFGFLGLWYVQWHTRARTISESHRQSKIEVYNVFFEIVEHFQNEHSNVEIQTREDIPEELRAKFQRLNRGLVIWGSPDVIRAWLHFRESSGQGGLKVLVAVDQMYRAIRKDLGNSNLGLQTGDLIKSTLSDPENWGKET